MSVFMNMVYALNWYTHWLMFWSKKCSWPIKFRCMLYKTGTIKLAKEHNMILNSNQTLFFKNIFVFAFDGVFVFISIAFSVILNTCEEISLLLAILNSCYQRAASYRNYISLITWCRWPCPLARSVRSKGRGTLSVPCSFIPQAQYAWHMKMLRNS